jgi:outer membrane receptor protein involved in Fe transport
MPSMKGAAPLAAARKDVARRTRLLAGLSLTALSLAAAPAAFAQTQDPPPPPQAPPPQTPQTTAPQTTAPNTPPPAPQKKTGTTVEGVTVQAAPTATVRTEIDRRSYSVSTDLKGANGSIADALRNVPGAEVDLNGNLTLRGGAVQIMVDGQPSQIFSGPQAAQVLQTTPADRIERVEVMNNPSAAFSPEGQAGIINLVTKKAAPSGVSGGVRANAGSSGHDNASGNFVYQAGKLMIQGDAGWQQNQYKFRINTTGTAVDPVTGLNDPRDASEVTTPPNVGWSAHTGFSYQLDPKTTLTGDLRYNTGGRNHVDDYSFLTTNPSGTPIAAYTRLGTVFPNPRISSEQLMWRRQLPGQDHTLVVFYNHTLQQIPISTPFTTLTTAPAPPTTVYQDQVSHTQLDINEFKIDYTKPMPKMGQLKAGYDLRNTEGEFGNYALFGSDAASATLNPLYTNAFHYGQMVNAAYLTYQQPIGALTVLGGLRVEDEQLDLDQRTQQVTVDRNNFGVFPTLHLGYAQNSNVTWVANYSLRIQRPGPQDLNPYRNLTDPANVTTGNPELQNEQTHSFEAGWEYRKGPTSYLATLYYRQSEHSESPVVTDIGGGVLLTTPENVASGSVGGLELVAAGPLSKTLSYNMSTNFSYTHLETPVLGVTQTHEGFNAGGRISLNWSPTKNDLIQLIGIINQGRVTAQGTVDPLFIFSAGYRHKINEKWSLMLQTQDPTDSTRQYSRVQSAGLDQITTLRAHIQTFMIGFIYTFGASGRPQPQGFDVGGGGL